MNDIDIGPFPCISHHTFLGVGVVDVLGGGLVWFLGHPFLCLFEEDQLYLTSVLCTVVGDIDFVTCPLSNV